MIRILIVLLILIPTNIKAACDCGSTDSANPCTGQSIVVTAPKLLGENSLNGNYTYTFNSGGGDARCGQFASGDYWIAPASGQSTVTITSISSTTHPSLISADVDPTLESMGLIGSTLTYANYNAGENIIPNLPLSYSGINSIVTALERNTSIEGNCTTEIACAASYNVITVLSSVPENAGYTVIRPNITGTSKMLLTWDDFDLSRIPTKSYLVGGASLLQAANNRWKFSTEMFGLKTDISTAGYSEGGRFFRASSMINDYGGGMAAEWGNDFMVISSDDNTIEEKKPAIASMISFGLDIYASVFFPPSPRDRFWGQGATQSPGKFPPAAFFAALAVNSIYRNNLAGESAHLSEYNETHGPHELGQIAHGTDARPLWGDRKQDDDNLNVRSYWGALFKQQLYDGATGAQVTPSNKEGYDPHGYIDGPPGKPDTQYMQSTYGNQRALVAQMFLMPEICETVNYDRLIAFVDQKGSLGRDTADDPCVTPDTRESSSCAPYPSGEGCAYYQVTWGPDPDNPGDCIKTPTPPYTQAGRFVSQDGTVINASYTSGQVESNWAEIRGTNSTCRRYGQFTINGSGQIHLSGSGTMSLQ